MVGITYFLVVGLMPLICTGASTRPPQTTTPPPSTTYPPTTTPEAVCDRERGCRDGSGMCHDERDLDLDLCTGEWSEWSPCSKPCGGGFRYAERYVKCTCDNDDHPGEFRCHNRDIIEYKDDMCNTICFNGDYVQDSLGGRCECHSGWKGECCDEVFTTTTGEPGLMFESTTPPTTTPPTEPVCGENLGCKTKYGLCYDEAEIRNCEHVFLTPGPCDRECGGGMRGIEGPTWCDCSSHGKFECKNREVLHGDERCNAECYNNGTYHETWEWYGSCECLPGSDGDCCKNVYTSTTPPSTTTYP